MVKAQRFLMLVENVLHLIQVLFMDGEGNILGLLPADGLQDHVHIDIVLAQQVKNLERNAGVVL